MEKVFSKLLIFKSCGADRIHGAESIITFLFSMTATHPLILCEFTLSQEKKFTFLLVGHHEVSIVPVLKIIKVPMDSSSVIHCASLTL